MSKYLRFAVSLGLLALLAWQTRWDDVAERFANLRAQWFLTAVVVLVLGWSGSARRWQIYAKELGFEGSWWQFCRFYFIGTYFNLVLPTSVGGDAIRVVYLNAGSGRKWPAFVSVLVERATGLLVLIAFACGGLFFCSLALPDWIVGCVWVSAVGSILATLVLGDCRRLPWLSAQRRQQFNLFVGVFYSGRLWVRAGPLSVLTQAAGIVVVWCLTKSIGLDVPFAYCCLFAPLLTLLMMLPVSVGGMGVREGGMVLLLAPLRIDTGSALTLAFLLFSVGAVVGLFGGGLYLCGTGRAGKRTPHLNPVAAGSLP